jgi:hypothetical protein
VPEELGGNGGCQIEVDGILQNCSLVTRDNVQMQVRNGDKVTNFDPNRELPGTMLHFTVTWEETRTNSGWTTQEDENGNQTTVWSDYIGASTTVHFSNISISSWDFAHSTGRMAGPDKGGSNPCEQTIASTIGDNGAVFEDVTDGDGFDSVLGYDRTPADASADEHNHLYNLTGKSVKGNGKWGISTVVKTPTNIYAPSGFQVVGQGVWEGQRWLSLYYKDLNGVKDVVLQFWHVEGAVKSASISGRTQIGNMGENGNIQAGSMPNKMETWHVHLNAYKWWGKKGRNGKLIGDALGLRSEKSKLRIPLSRLFCK